MGEIPCFIGPGTLPCHHRMMQGTKAAFIDPSQRVSPQSYRGASGIAMFCLWRGFRLSPLSSIGWRTDRSHKNRGNGV
jgi:hypothetical protein